MGEVSSSEFCSLITRHQFTLQGCQNLSRCANSCLAIASLFSALFLKFEILPMSTDTKFTLYGDLNSIYHNKKWVVILRTKCQSPSTKFRFLVSWVKFCKVWISKRQVMLGLPQFNWAQLQAEKTICLHPFWVYFMNLGSTIIWFTALRSSCKRLWYFRHSRRPRKCVITMKKIPNRNIAVRSHPPI